MTKLVTCDKSWKYDRSSLNKWVFTVADLGEPHFLCSLYFYVCYLYFFYFNLIYEYISIYYINTICNVIST